MVTHRKGWRGLARVLAPTCRSAYHAAMLRCSTLLPFVWALGACIEDTQPRVIPDTGIDLGDAAQDVVDATTCDEPGITRCAEGEFATEVCRDGTWQRTPCASDKICVFAGGAQCVSSTGDADCRDTLYCFLGCQILHPGDESAAEACWTTCYVSATQPAQRELSDALGCFDANCADQGFECIAERCSQDLADCYFESKGEQRCGEIVECRLACPDEDTACQKACGGDASIEAQGQYAVLELCTFYQCAGQDEDCPRRVSLPTGPCYPYASDCVGLLPNIAR